MIDQALFSKRLNRNQWLAILLITLGCVCKESSKLNGDGLSASTSAWALLLLQMASTPC